MDDPEGRIQRQKKDDELDKETDYHPTDWKKFLLSWKFFGMQVFSY